MANGDDAFSKVIRGFEAGQSLTQRAVELEQRRFQLEEQKRAVKIQKMDSVFKDMNNLLTVPKSSRMRPILKKRAQAKAQEMGVVVDQGVWEMFDDDDLQVPLGQNMAAFFGISDPKQKGALIDSISPLMADPVKFRSAAIQQAAKLQAESAARGAKSKDAESANLIKLFERRGKSDVKKRTDVLFESLNRIRVSGGNLKRNPALEGALRASGISTKQLSPSAAGDLALIFNFMRMQDPGSVVRESEFAAAAASGSLPARANAAVQRVLSGQRLATEQRADFINTAEKLWISQKQAQRNFDAGLMNEARALQLPLDKVTTGFGSQSIDPKEQKAAKNIRTIEFVKEKLRAKGLSDQQIDEMISRGSRERKAELLDKDAGKGK